MATEVQIALQPQAGQDPAAALTAAAAKLARSSLEMLVQQTGQPLTGRIVPPPPNLPSGFSQVAIADMVLTLKLSAPLPAGTPVRVDVQQNPTGQPAVTVQPLPQNPAPTAAPATPTPQALLPLPPAPQSTPPMQQQAVASQPIATQTNPPRPAPRAAVLPAQVQPATTSAPSPQPGVAPATSAPPAAPFPVATTAPQTATPQTATIQPPQPTAPTPVSTASVPSAQAAPMPQPTAPAPQVSAMTLAAQPAGAQSAVPTPSQPAPQVATAAQPTEAQPMPAPSLSPSPSAPLTSTPTSPTQTASQPQTAAQQPLPQPAPQPPAPTAPARVQTLVQRLTQALASPPAATPTPPPPVPGSPAQAVLAATTQAAAQQQSPGPLLQALAVSLPQLPKPVAEAAERVLAARVSLDRGAPTADGLKQAVLKSGVFLGAPARPDASPDLRQALTQLRGTLLAWLGDDIAPVAAVGRRPLPPARGATPRAQMPDLPQQPAEGSPRDAGKSLLNQTEGALARIRLMQLGSHAPEAAGPRAPMAAPSEWNLELPMMIGHELAMAQIQIQRDGKGKAEAKEKSWRLRFALKFSVLGEVGAQVAMVGARASVGIWADEPETADTLEAMLPELAPALAAKGLELTSLTVRRSAPRDESQPAGRLMDSLR